MAPVMPLVFAQIGNVAFLLRIYVEIYPVEALGMRLLRGGQGEHFPINKSGHNLEKKMSLCCILNDQSYTYVIISDD